MNSQFFIHYSKQVFVLLTFLWVQSIMRHSVYIYDTFLYLAMFFFIKERNVFFLINLKKKAIDMKTIQHYTVWVFSWYDYAKKIIWTYIANSSITL